MAAPSVVAEGERFSRDLRTIPLTPSFGTKIEIGWFMGKASVTGAGDLHTPASLLENKRIMREPLSLVWTIGRYVGLMPRASRKKSV